MSVKLKKLTIRGYRSCINTTIIFNSDLSVLIGVNGAGKTNILKAIMLLKDVVSAIDRNQETPISTLRANYSEIFLSAEFEVLNMQATLKAKAFLGKKHRRRVTEEVVFTKQNWIINGKEALKDVNIRSLDRVFFFDSGKLVQEKSLNKLRKLSGRELLGHESWQIISEIKTFIDGITYYSASQFTDPSKASSVLEIESGKPFIRNWGLDGHHDRILADIYMTYKNSPAIFENFLRIIGPTDMALVSKISFEEYELPFSMIDFSPGGSIKKIKEKKVMVVPLFTISKKRLAANQLSEGTFKTIALMFYLVSNQGNLLLVEEPEVCVHHGLLKKLCKRPMTPFC